MTSFLDHFLTEVVMDNGTIVWARGVPPYTLKDVYAKHPPPDTPIVTLESDAGSERKMALPGSPEYIAWQDARRLWKVDVNRALIDHHMGYGIVKWKFPWDEEIYTDAIDGWVPDAVTSKYHPDPDEEERRILFIRECILITQEDVEDVDVILYSIKPVEKEDVVAAMVPTSSRSEDSPPNLDH